MFQRSKALYLVAFLNISTSHAAFAEVDLSKFSSWGSSSIDLLQAPLRSQIASWFDMFNGGFGSNYQDAILAHQGGVKAQISFSTSQLDELNRTGETEVTVGNIVGRDVISAIEGEIAGTDIKGNLSYSAAHSGFIFKKDSGSATLSSSSLYQLSPKVGSDYAKGFQLLNMGKADLIALSAIADIVAGFEAADNISNEADRHILILGHFAVTSSPSAAAIATHTNTLNDALRAKYGARFIDINAYVLGSDIWTDIGITPTATDLDYQSRGLVAPSLSADNIHLSTAAYQAAAEKLIIPAIKNLFLSDSRVSDYIDFLNHDLLPAIGNSYLIFNEKTSQLAAQARQAHAHDWLVGRPDGMRVSLQGGADRSKGLSAKGRDLSFEISYRAEGRGISFGFSRIGADHDKAGNDLNLSGQSLFLGIRQDFGDWTMGVTLGRSTGDLTASYNSGSRIDYSAKLQNNFAEVEIGYRYENGDWKVLPSAWLRAQQSEIKNIAQTNPTALKNDLSLSKSRAMIGGVGVNMAFMGWQRLPMEIIPSLSISYENNFSSDQGAVTASNGLINGQLVQAALPHKKGSLIIEPSISMRALQNGEIVLSSWYRSANRTYGLGLRFNNRF